MDTLKHQISEIRQEITERGFTTPLWQKMHREIDIAKRRRSLEGQELTGADLTLDLMKNWLKKTDVELQVLDPGFKVEEVPMSRRLRSEPIQIMGPEPIKKEPEPMRPRRTRAAEQEQAAEPIEPTPKVEYIGRRARAAAEAAAEVEEIQEVDELETEPEVDELETEPEVDELETEPEPEKVPPHCIKPPEPRPPDPATCGKNPMLNDCTECPRLKDCYEENLKYRLQIPFFVIDNYLTELSKPALVILLFLARRADFGEHSKHFSKAWASHKEISGATGIKESAISHYTRELTRAGLISRTKQTKMLDGNFVTIIQYSILWYQKMKKIKLKIK